MSRVPHPAKMYKEPLSVRLWRYGRFLAVVLGVLAVLYGLAWVGTAYVLRDTIKTWFADQQTQGMTAAFDENQSRLSGFPFVVTARVPAVTWARSDQTVITAPLVELSVTPLPWRLKEVSLTIPQGARLTHKSVAYEIQADQAQLDVDWSGVGLPDWAHLMIKDMTIQNTQAGKNIKIAQGQAMLSGRESDAPYELDMNLNGIRIGEEQKSSDFLLRLAATHGLQLYPVTQAGLAEWRDQGGTLDISRLALEVDRITVQSSGILALDGNVQPVGSLSARIGGFFGVVDQLVRQGIIRRQDASMAKIMLGALAKQPENGGVPILSVPLTVQNQTLFVGPVALAHVPFIHWPE